jgi:methionine-rich copper-binding protein CopC
MAASGYDKMVSPISGVSVMGWRRRTLLNISLGAGLFWLSSAARAEDLKVLETNPAANKVMDTHSDGFYVRFNQPVDHINSRLLVKRGDVVVETLVPRLQSNPNVLFARAPTLAPGQYIMHWVVKTVADARIEQGDVPFSIAAPK